MKTHKQQTNMCIFITNTYIVHTCMYVQYLLHVCKNDEKVNVKVNQITIKRNEIK